MRKLFRRLFGIHKCNYTIPEMISGVLFLKCDHKGCMNYDIHPEQSAKDDAEWNSMMNKLKSFATPDNTGSRGSMWHPNETL